MCMNLNPSGRHPLESRMRSKVQVRFGGSQTEKEQLCHLAGWLPYSRKRAFGQSLLASFSLSYVTQPSIEEGYRSLSPEKIPIHGRQIIREGISWLQERPAKTSPRLDIRTVVPLQAAR